MDDKKDLESLPPTERAWHDVLVASTSLDQSPNKEKINMAARSRAKAAPAPEPVVEETEESGSAKRGPSALTKVFVGWLGETYGVDAKTPLEEVVYLAQTTRRQFRDSEAYAEYLDGEEERKEQAAAEKAKRAEERAAAAQAAPAEASEEAPKPARRSRTKAAAPAPAAEEAAPEPAKPARRTRAKAAAEPVAEASAEAAPTTTRRRATKAPF